MRAASTAPPLPGRPSGISSKILVGALRVLPRGQVAALVPLVETYRATRHDSQFGGGVGDVNLSARYDFVVAGESRWMPGVAVHAGVTFPTGRPVESARPPLATDATGIGAYQANVGLSLEQLEGPWLFGLSALVAQRATRTVNDVSTSLGSQWTLLATTAYTFSNDTALAAVLTYTLEGNAKVAGAERPGTSRRLPVFNLSGVYPFSDHLRLQGGLFTTLPISGWGRNSPSDAGLTMTLVHSWS